MTVIDLKKEKYFVDQYIRLRNRHADRLLTRPVLRAETEAWLNRDDIAVQGLAENELLLGVVILYVGKGGEVSFFTETPGRGVGTRLLRLVEEEAGKRALPSVWAWVLLDNPVARHVFEKCGFVREGAEDRLFQGEWKKGIKYRKVIQNHQKGS